METIVIADDMKTILVVEDDVLIRTLETAALNGAGYRVLNAADGVEGAVVFSRDFQQIDLLLTDISLPGMRGPDLARFARVIRPDLKVLFVSGSLLLEETSPLQLIEGSSYLDKPFTIEQLLGAVAQALTAIPGPSAGMVSELGDPKAGRRDHSIPG